MPAIVSALLAESAVLRSRAPRPTTVGTARARNVRRCLDTASAIARASPRPSSFARHADADADVDAALARRRALFLLDGNDAPPPPRPSQQQQQLVRIWRVGIDEPRLLKALEGAGFAGRVAVAPSAARCDAVLAVPRKAAGGRQAVDLAAARAAARNARAEFVLLRATTARAVFEALAPMVARRELGLSGRSDEEEEEEEQDGASGEAAAAERVAAAVERLRRAAPALRPDDRDREDDDEGDVGFTRVPTLRAVAAVASGVRPAASAAAAATASSGSAAASTAMRLLSLLAWSDAVAARSASGRPAPTGQASRRPLLSPPRAARLPEPAWLWLGTAGVAAAAASGGGDEGGGSSSSGSSSSSNSNDDDDPDGRAAMVPRNRDARADAGFRVTRDDGGPLQPGAPGDARRRRQAAEERRRRAKGGGGGGGW